MIRAVLIAGALVSSGAAAQGFQGSQRLLFWEGTLRGSPRLMGLSGAYVAIAEGAEGMIRNPAATVAKDPHFENEFNVDLGGTMHFLFPGSTRQQDWDNDGRPEQVDGAPFTNLGTQVLYSALALQYKQFGFGLGLDTQNFLTTAMSPAGDTTRYYNVTLLHLFASIAGSFWRDQILIGVGVETTHAFLAYAEQQTGALLPSVKQSNGYHGWGVQLGGLWRPENEDYRIGIAFKPQVTGAPAATPTDLGGITPPSGIAVPGRLSIGGAYALGWGRHLNITSPLGWERPPPEYRRALAQPGLPIAPAPPPPTQAYPPSNNPQNVPASPTQAYPPAQTYPPSNNPQNVPPSPTQAYPPAQTYPPSNNPQNVPPSPTQAYPNTPQNVPPSPTQAYPPAQPNPAPRPPPATPVVDAHPEDPGTAAMTKFLFTAQLDIFFPVQNAVAMAAFLEQPAVDAIPAGDHVSFELRLGVEKEVIADRLRLRVGGYLEPPINATGYLRPHVTFGGELYLFKLGRQRISFGLAFDFASRYQNLSVAILTWK